ncbi:Hypothetical predicted protein [Pelobates cultripes]|uniref:Uncharacterized protein n=1 Tax=Pelobates cultripes TaxID=61616 RepID=A0AAD1VUI0_PELCU|nr:Hypothetical predicted protein [Pelobates cultripes]
MSKKPWGTISASPFPLGHQFISNSEIANVVERLHSSKQCTRCGHTTPRHQLKSCKILSQKQLNRLLERLTLNYEKKVPDSNRTHQGKIRDMELVNSYAWKGWN